MSEKVTLLMTTFNCKEHFEQSIQSALSQDYDNLEIVIADGGSSDGTLDRIRYYAETVKQNPNGKTIVWKSEPDHGIYDGMNKAIRMSSGEVLAVFNDLFTSSHAVSTMISALNSGEYQGVHADLVYMNKGKCCRYWKMGQGNLHFGWMPAHPTLYLKREVYEKYGLYDLKYHSSSDYDFMLRILKDGTVKLAYVPEVMIEMFYGGTSNGAGYWNNVREAYQTLLNNRISFPLTAIVCRSFRTLIQYWNAKDYKGS